MNTATNAVINATLLIVGGFVQATPEEDRLRFHAMFAQTFPQVIVDDFVNGFYALNADAREQWAAIEEFPPYEIALDEGEDLYNTPFANGKTYVDCFDNGGIGIRQYYPRFDSASGQVVTLELAINQCRTSNGEEALPYKRGAIASISAYMAYTSRGKRLSIQIPDDPRALAAYAAGKKFFYGRRGQLNFACSHCHVDAAGKMLRGDLLSAALGHPAHYPQYRSGFGEMGTLHRFFGVCNTRMRAQPFNAQSEEYRNLEYFYTYMSNGLPVNGPGTRK